MSQHLKNTITSPHFKESQTNTINLSYTDEDNPNFSLVIEPMLQYMYTFPLNVDDFNLGLLWHAFHYFEIPETDIINLVSEKIPIVSLGDYHSILREIIFAYGQEYSVQVFNLVMSVFSNRIVENFNIFFSRV